MNHHLVRRLALGLGLALLLAACSGGEKPGKPDATASVPPAEPTVSPVETGAVYDDSLLTESISQEGDYDDGELRFHYEYRLPQLPEDTEGGRAGNRLIEDRLGYFARAAVEGIRSGMPSMYQSITWESFWNGSLVSLLLTARTENLSTEYHAINYDFAAGELVDGPALMARLGRDPQEVLDGIRFQLLRELDYANQGTDADDLRLSEGLEELRFWTLERNNINEALDFYLDADGRLRVVVPMAIMAGGGWADQLLWPDQPREYGPPLKEEGGLVTAQWQNGVLTVTYHQTPDAEYLLPEGVPYEKPLTVAGAWGNYTAMRLSDLCHYLFLLDDQGLVSCCDLSQGMQYDCLTVMGPLHGPTGVTAFSDAELPEGNVVLADGDAGDSWILDRCAIKLHGFRLNSLRWQPWYTPDGLVELMINEEDQPVYREYTPDGSVQTEYTGWMDYFGMTEDGCRFFLYFGGALEEEEAAEFYQEAIQLRLEDTEDGAIMVVGSLGGDGLLGLRPGESMTLVDRHSLNAGRQ